MSKIGDSSTFQDLIDIIKANTAPISHDHTVSDISDFPTLGTAANKDVPVSGNASSSEVVLGSDTRLTDSRTPLSHTHTVSDISDFPNLGTAANKDVPVSGNAGNSEVVLGNDTRLTDSRTPTSHTHTVSDISDLAQVAISGSYNDLTDTPSFPTFGTAASRDVPSSGDAAIGEVVLGSDSRLTDSRTPLTHTHTVSDISDFPTIPTFGTAATKDVPVSGNAGNSEVVLGSDSRLTDSRTPTSHTHTASDITDLPQSMAELGQDGRLIPAQTNYVSAGRKANTTVGDKSTAEGYNTTASGMYSHAEGTSRATATSSHAEGDYTAASGYASHAEGISTTANGDYSHAEGNYTTAGGYAHAEGERTTASGKWGHAQGYYCTASGLATHAEGAYCVASNDYSHVEGYYTKTGASYQHVQGKYNVGKATTLFEIGNGTGTNARSNAFEVSSTGDVVAAGDITDGSGNNLSQLSNLATVATSGSYNDLTDTPSLPTFGTAASKDVPASGDAAIGEVVMGNDSRLTDSRTPTSHSHTVSDISNFPSAMPPTSHTHTASDISDAGVASGLATLDANGKVPSSQLPAISASVETKEFNGSSYNSFGDLLYDVYTWGGDKIINASLYVTSQYWLYSVDFAFKKVSNKLRMTMNARYGNADRVVFGHHWRCTKTDNTSGYSNEIYSSTSTTYPADESGTVTGYASNLSASSLQYYILTVTKIA